MGDFVGGNHGPSAKVNRGLNNSQGLFPDTGSHHRSGCIGGFNHPNALKFGAGLLKTDAARATHVGINGSDPGIDGNQRFNCAKADIYNAHA